MAETKNFQIHELPDGQVIVLSKNKRQMAGWYALDYLLDKPELTDKGNYRATMNPEYFFSPGFRRKIQRNTGTPMRAGASADERDLYDNGQA